VRSGRDTVRVCRMVLEACLVRLLRVGGVRSFSQPCFWAPHASILYTLSPRARGAPKSQKV
jgi:hypothetical protein